MSQRRYPENPIPSVAAVVVSSMGILLMRRNKPPYNSLWNIPSGAIKVGETQEVAVIREVIEESGINCHVIKFLDTSDVIITDSNDLVEYHFIVNVYLLKASTNEIHSTDEGADMRWFHPCSIPIEDMPPGVSRSLRGMEEQLLELM